ncbi:MAG TPA: class I tRNA ligase family protein, partial [Ilumatobacteraceae bacterium]|nr:class I tRNA ligase family protein [Ilumatobacteraceae bacterium]
NADGPKFSFIDGPVTANKSLAVHTAWGRTLKDVFQRYKALNGFHQRYQNGFDCQGLWIEVGVEKALGLNSKREIEEYGLAEFANQCRAVVEQSSADLTAGSIRLGQWMDWGNDYFTFSDTNIEYIWKFLSIVNERGWLAKGHRATEWCPRCGTSISAHELAGSYIDKDDPSLYVRFPLLDRPGEALVIWTTTPWTLPANVAAAVKPELTYGRRANGDWLAVDSPGATALRGVQGVDADDATGGFVETKLGSELIGWRYEGPFDMFAPGAAAGHRVIPWDAVSTDDGTGVVHIAPGCGSEDFELGKEHGLVMIQPVDEIGRFYPDFGWLAGQSTVEAKDAILADLTDRNRLLLAGTVHHRFPECWRCHTPLIFRISDDWFISVVDLRQPMRDANAAVEWTPAYMGKRMDDWLVNMGDISRRRYYGLPLPFYPCSCGHLTVIGSRQQLAELAVRPDGASADFDPLADVQELRRPWIDAVRIHCPACSQPVSRIEEVGDVWLDAGIVPFSTLGWQNDTWVPGGYGTGAAKGLTTADLPDHSYWQEWFPADWVSEMREQIRLWFYSQLFMSVVLTGRAPYDRVLGYEKMLDETGREMHGSWGNQIDAPDAFQRMGADVMRWQFCQQPPSQDLLFGFKPAYEIQRKMLTLWNSVAFFVQYANVAGFTPSYDALTADGCDAAAGDTDAHSMDRWLHALTQRFLATATEGYEAYLSVNVLRAFEQYVDDVSNWYIRRSRRRFWNGDADALNALWVALVQGLRAVAPIMPFVTEQLWQQLVRDVCPDAPPSVFLAGWPTAQATDDTLLAEVATMRTVIELGRRARSAAKLPLRQPLSMLAVDLSHGADAIDLGAYADEIAEELRVKQVAFEPIEATQIKVRPNLKTLGPRLGSDVNTVRQALAAGEFEMLPDGSCVVAGHTLPPADLLVERTDKEGWAVATDDANTITVAFETTLTDELRTERRVYDLIHDVNGRRKETGLEITDRIALSLAAADADLVAHADWIKAETLTVDLTVGTTDDFTIAKAVAADQGA